MSSPASTPATISPEATRVTGRRYVAHLVDGVLFFLLFVFALLLVDVLPTGTAADAGLWVVLVLGLTVGHVAYFVLQERRHGRTAGKRLVGIRVVDERGAVPSAGALVKRTVPLLIEYVYVIALVGMLTSPYRQRFGDRWAGTFVVSDE